MALPAAAHSIRNQELHHALPPRRYVKDLDGHEIAEIRSIAEQTYGAATDHAAQSTPWGNAYVQTEALRKALAKTE